MSQADGNGLHKVVTRCQDGVFLVAPDGRITLWNDAAERILGHAARDVVGRPCRQVLGASDGSDDSLCCQEADSAADLDAGNPVRVFDVQTQARSGRQIWLNVSVHLGCDESGKRFAIHVIRDVTETRELLALVQQYTPGEADSALTRRELEILRFVATGAGTKAVAEQLKVSPSTVRNHVQNIMGKLGVHSRLQAVAYANRHRLLSSSRSVPTSTVR